MLTDVTFHFNVADRQHYLCRLLRKVLLARKRACVLLPEQEAYQLDQTLWTFSQEEFVPHALWRDAPALRQRSPICLGPSLPPDMQTEVLINALPEAPLGWEGFERLLEIVGPDPQEREAARQRWRAYQRAGHAVQGHDAAGAGRGA